MTHVNRAVLERVTALDLNLFQRFPAREQNAALRLMTRQRRNSVSGSISASQEVDRTVCLGGLEVKYTSGSTVQITAGKMMASNVGSEITETRPGTYSPSPVEPDTDRFEVATLAATTTVAPASPLGTASGNEWWIVYVTAAETTVESDSARVVFNETTGVFDATTAAKIGRWTLTPGVLRGSAGDTITTVAGGLPANSEMIAWIWVPSGATSLSNALFFDVRKLVDPNAPNECGGRGRYGYDGTPSFTAAMSAPTSDTETFSGHFWARIKGQALSVVAPSGAGLSALKIKDPGATWDSGASTSTPKVAWLYLAAPAGYVPRLYAKGTSSIGNGGGNNELIVMHGALILSSRAPKGAVPTAGASVKTSGLYDLRPSGTLHMPVSYTVGGITYAFDGLTSDDAICLGPVLYNGYDTPNDCPVIAGPCHVSPDGWIGWTMGAIWAGFPATDLITSCTPSGTGTDTITITVTLATVGTGPAPITAVRLNTEMLGGYYLTFWEGKPNAGKRAVCDRYGTGSGTDQKIYWETEIDISPQQATAVAVGKGTDELYASTITNANSHVQAIRWPFNEPLATLRRWSYGTESSAGSGTPPTRLISEQSGNGKRIFGGKLKSNDGGNGIAGRPGTQTFTGMSPHGVGMGKVW